MKFALHFGVVVLLLTAVASAGTITYTESGIATGSLGGNLFRDALVTLTMTGDTSNVTGGAGFFSNPTGTFTVFVAGIGTGNLTGSPFVFVNQGFVPEAVGFGDVGGSIMDTLNNGVGNYDLTTAFGPITGTAFIRPDLSFSTSLGLLNIQLSGDTTFTATTVPEPGSVLLLGSSLLGLAGTLRRRFLS